MKRTLLFALFAAGCGGSPSAPTVPAPPAPAPMAVEVRDGWTGAPVAVSVPPALPGSTVSVSAPGYLTRVQILSGPVFLWPQDEAFVRQLVYGEMSTGLLARWSRGFSISAPGYEDLARQVAAEVSRVTGLAVAVTDGPSGDVVVSMDGSDPYWSTGNHAYATDTFQGHTIISVRIVFRDQAAANLKTFLHEMGHGLGLSHVEGQDVMSPSERSVRAFSERETVAIRMMYARRTAGNAPPDRDGVASASLRTVRFVD